MKKLFIKKAISTALALLLSGNILSALPDLANAATNQPSILPKPVSYTTGTGQFLLTQTSSIFVAGNTAEETDELFKTGQMLANKLNTSTGFPISVIKSNNPTSGSIYLTTIGGNAALGNEGYDLITTSNQVTLTANKPEGVFRGDQTLIQLLPADIEKNTVVSGVQWVIPNSTISDKPAYEYRGLMLDVARHFFAVDQVKRQIDLASQYKINKLHMHLSDDQAWRIEIKSRPDLVQIGSKGQVGGGPGGYYTQEQFKDIVSYAAERYIEVIPEIDMPGHTNAALASYGELNPDGQRKAMRTDTAVGYSSLMPRSEVTYTFVDDVIRELAAISPSPYIHIGGDEAQSTTAADYDYFIGRVTTIVNNYGKKVIGWDPSDTSSGATSDSILQDWHCTTSTGTSAKTKGMKVIVSPANAYLDQKYYSDTPLGLTWRGLINTNTAYNWNPTDCISGANIYGIDSTLWSETVVTQDNLDYMLYPRLIANAEVGWTAQSNRNWADFKGRLTDQASRMQNKGIKYFADPIVWVPPFVPINSEWKMDEGTGTSLADTSGARNGTLVGGATLTTGKFGNGVNLDGSTGYINLGGQDITGDWTVSAWVYGKPNTTSNEVLLAGSSSSIKINQYNKTGKVGVSIYGVKDATYTYSIPSNQWTHLAFVGTSTGTALYANGVLKGTITGKMNGPMSLVGVEAQPGTGLKTSYFKGSLDELKIFNRALSASQIVALTKSPTATLSSINVNGSALNGFTETNTDYNVILPSGTTTVPTVEVTKTDNNASAVVTAAAALPGTTTIKVTAENGTTTKTYNVNFLVIPDAPTELTAVANGATDVTLNWSAVPGAERYNIYRADSKSGIFEKVNDAEVLAATYSDLNLNPDTVYDYQVTAVNTTGESDYSNVAEINLNIPPVTVAKLDGTKFGEWYQTPVTITLDATDNFSGVADTFYTVDGGTEQKGTSVTIIEEGNHTISYWSVDKAGNVETPHTAVVQLDKTAPTLHVVLDKIIFWPANHQMITVSASVYAEDSHSGIESVVLTSIISNESDNGLGDSQTLNDIQGAELGTLDTTFLLRAERSGKGNGRIYTLTYTAFDHAGNKTSASSTVTVPHDESGE
ncbi:family 20 glycosylhydrolase [Paenibacillus sp. Soil787]|uniref:family 20 glycosylhydrolase n=1 Tax=Paenibacillus sp. Soil787 TaxID=1736411 RepID=UPI0007C6A77C|nr:family 20 glycosylhydrolase [Paenibacillus sp. Soil787]